MVSYVDKTAEEMLVAGLTKILPESGFITEEETVVHQKKSYTWIIDPLDGTTNFIHGVPAYSISVALMHDDDIVMGHVYEITRDELFFAVKGQGAYLNGASISVTSVDNIADSLISTGFPVKNFDHLEDYLGIIKEIVQHSHGIRRGGSAATDLAYVACGRYDAFFEYNLNPWDVAAGILIIKEAGGIVTDFHNKDNALFGKQIVAGGALHKALLRVIRKYWDS